MSFGVYRYQHSQFGPIMLLLDSEPGRRVDAVPKVDSGRHQSRLDESVDYDSKLQNKEKRGQSYRMSPSLYFTNDRSMEREQFQAQRNSLEKARRAEDRSVQLPMIPKGKKKKIEI